MDAANPPPVAVATLMAQRGIEFLNCLRPSQKHKAMYEYSDRERLYWYYTPLKRHGLPLRDMLPYQRECAMTFMATGLTSNLYKTVHRIMELETILGSLERNEGRLSYTRDPELYYFTMFGRPGDNDVGLENGRASHIVEFQRDGEHCHCNDSVFPRGQSSQHRQ